MRYWAYRIDTSNIKFLREELESGRLRQGWGSHPGQDLRKLDTPEFVDRGAGRNRRIFKQVKRGHILLVPRLPEWDKVAIVEAVEDFDTAYMFEIDPTRRDFGHCFPGKIIGSFVRSAIAVNGNIRTTLRNPQRFWNLDVYRDDIQKILDSPETSRLQTSQPTERLKIAIDRVSTKLREDLYKLLDEQHEGSEWENILTEVLTGLYPDYLVEAVGGRHESEHGTDILISVPGIGGDGAPDYGIAIQVKDRTSLTEDAIKQVQSAPEYWKEARGLRFVDKCVLLTKAQQDEGTESDDVKIIWAEDLKKMLKQYVLRR